MHFADLAGLLHMDGHGAYVWSAYLIAVALLVYNALAPGLRLRALRRLISLHAGRAESEAGGDTGRRQG